MADLLHITTPVSPKNYDFSPKTAAQPTGNQVFNLGDTSQIQKTNERTEEFTNQDTKNGSGSISIGVSVSKNPTAAVSILRSIVGSETMNALSASGNSAVLSKVTEFANEVMLSSANIASDMVNQANQATVFSAPIWSEMKNLLVNSSSADIGEAVLSFTKAAVDANARDDILVSVSDSLRYLANEIAPSRELAGQLTQVADALNGQTFAELKGDILSLVSYTESSLLLNDANKNLLPLLIYNLSRYNESSTALGESFGSLLNMLDSALADKLKGMFADYIESSELPADIKLASLKSLDPEASAAKSSLTLIAEKIGEAMNANSSAISSDTLAGLLSGLDVTGGTGSLRSVLSAMLPPSMNGALNNILRSYDSTGDMGSLIDRLSIIINSVDDMDKKILLADAANSILTHLSASDTSGRLISDSIISQQSLLLLSEKLGNSLNANLAQISPRELSTMLSGLDTTGGASSVRSILTQLVPPSSMQELNTILRSFNATGNLNKLIDNLGMVLNSVDNLDKKIIIAQSLNEVLGNIASSGKAAYNPPTSMENLFDFLSKNINDPSLKSLSAMSRSDMLQGLLTAPGVFTPLLHFLVPVNDNGFKAFGELWVDPDSENKSEGQEAGHMLLCFEIESAGYFELEIFSQDRELNVNLLCPSGTEKIFTPLKTSVPQLAQSCGYTVKNTGIGTLVKRRDLTQVFPKINNGRGGLNVRI